ncbi:MAG: GAF domain-containing protein [Deltaproteobacteria bacterium]|nr:GAF domain-containing protein [Deltaproteobacteria bacterium]
MNLQRRATDRGAAPYFIEERRRTDPQRDRIRLAVLAEIGLLFASGGDHRALLQRVADIAVPALGDWGAVDLRDAEGGLERVAEAGGNAVRRSRLAVPMAVRGHVLGVFALARQDGVSYDRDDLAFAEELARRVALFIDHSLLLKGQQKLIEDLEGMNRELDQFAAVISHDLRAPLRGIGNLASMLEEDLAPHLDDSCRTNFELLRGRARRLEGMIDGVLRYYRAGRADERAVQVDVGALVLELVQLVAAPPAIEISLDPMPTIATARVPLEQVFINLISNAIKHGTGPAPRIVIGATPSSSGYEFFVRDNGPGIAREHHDKIWGVFRTLASRDIVDTTGVGLAIVRRIVESRGGRVWVESALGEGATFRFTWPLADASRRGHRIGLASR